MREVNRKCSVDCDLGFKVQEAAPVGLNPMQRRALEALAE
jgi:hypothetical protein